MDEIARQPPTACTVDLPFPDRRGAGRSLGRELAARQQWPNPAIVLGLSRGGLMVAAEIAAILGAALDLLPVCSMRTARGGSLSLGAVAAGGIQAGNDGVIRKAGVSRAEFERAAVAARRDLEGLARCRDERPAPRIRNQSVILVDDGLATGARLRAAMAVVHPQRPARLALAVPVAAPEPLAALRAGADEVVCLATPEPFYSVSDWYLDFTLPPDSDIRTLLADGHGP